jgi:ATP-binding protein involved in chromosome partitioning
VPLLARIPLVPVVRETGDAGHPIVLAEPHGVVAQTFTTLARRVLDAAAAATPTGSLGVAPA